MKQSKSLTLNAVIALCSACFVVPDASATAFDVRTSDFIKKDNFIQAADAAGASDSLDAQAQAQDFIKTMGQDAIAFLGDKSLSMDEKKQKFSVILDNNFDMVTIGRFCLGPYWKNLTVAQQQEYQALFRKLIILIYAQKFSNYQGQKFEVGDTQLAESGDMIVRSFIVPITGEHVAVDWHVRRKNDGYRIIDVKVENVSMAITKKSEFSSLIQSKGGDPEALLVQLREKNK